MQQRHGVGAGCRDAGLIADEIVLRIHAVLVKITVKRSINGGGERLRSCGTYEQPGRHRKKKQPGSGGHDTSNAHGASSYHFYLIQATMKWS